MAKSKVRKESEVLASKPVPKVCEECKSEEMECCEVTLNKNYKVYYMKCHKCHEVEVFKIGKEKGE
jgi:hypothetical protein